ncbi:histone-lysine N-methyltransferase SETD2 isoform X1 [Ahaetulla prasina]|uniref:histone-lysine N-methyltransferase SETD2 isoform X1 n=1 Tax=Ahaetulla prasina TaxID=499056 RepID=UPI0026492D72|nr:histone-lysine N-methyltransferase SETD2 isoform X1 [Ahaetulla prasina]
MEDFYDPEHPTPDTAFTQKDPSGHQKANAPSSAEIAVTSEVEGDHRCIFAKSMDGSEEVEREEENEGKSENVQKPGFLKGPVFKGVASSRFLPKGTRTKVNLEEQGRQKVSFSFSLTKKTLPNRFLAALGNEKSSESPGTSLPPLPSDFTSKLKAELDDPLGAPEEFSPPKPKAELGKIHFKKHLLNVTTKPFPVSALPPVPVAPLPLAAAELGEMPSSPPPPPPPFPPPPPPPPQIKPAPTTVLIPVGAPQVAIPAPVGPLLTSSVETIIRTIKESSPSPPQQALELQNTVLGDSEEHLAPGVSEEAEPALVKRHSHIGKEEEIADNSKGTPSSKKPRRKFSLSEGALPGSESDEDSVRTSSSQRSHEIKAAASLEKEKDSRKSSVASKMEEPPKVSSRSRSERDDKYSSYSRSERDSRYSSRSRSERERRRSRSRSRSERGSRTSSSYSRSERSHYYDSDRRYPRSSPYREKARYSRSYVDSRVRESSDSEEEYRRMHSRLSTDSRHASSHSSSYRDSRTSSSYLKSERESSKTDSTYPDMERRGKQARSERETRRISESDLTKKSSPVNEPRHRREASHSKAEGSGNSSRSKSTSSKTSAPKSDKFKSSFCCTESEDVKDQSNCVDSETSSVPGCEMKTALTQMPETERTVSPVSQFSDSLMFRKLDESKTGSPLSTVNELAGIDSHISIKDTGSLGKVRVEQLRTSSPVELDRNGSPERRTRKRLSSSFEVEEIDLSSDDNLDGSDLPPRAKSPKLSSKGLQTLSMPKGDNPDESVIFSGESNVQLLEVKMEVSNPPSPECVSSFTKQVSHSKTLSKEGSDPTDSSCKTKDPAPCYLPDDTSVSLSYSEIEIEVEPSDTEAAQEPHMGIRAEIPAQTFASTNVEDQNPSELAQENEKYAGFSSAEPTPVRGFTTEEYVVEVDNQQQPTSENVLHLETPIQQIAKEVLTCPEVALELDVLPAADSFVPKAKSPLKNEHCYYLEMPVKEPEKVPEKEELEGKDEVVFDEGMTSSLDKAAPGVLVMKDKEDSPMESAFSEVLSPSCQIVVTVEETETIEEEPRYGSSSNTPEVSSVHNEDYSDMAESASEHLSDESESEDSDSDDSSVPRNRLQSVVVIPKNSTLTLEESSSCSSRNSQSNRRFVDAWENGRPESTKPFCEDVPDSLELNNNLSNETRTLPSRESERSLATSTELKRTEGSGGPQPEASQPQSDDVDSTSHSEPATDSFHKPDERIVYNETTSVTRSVGVSQGEDLHYHSSFEMTNTMAGVSKLDRRQGRSAFAGLSHPADFSREDGFHSTEDLGSLGWDFSQPEKPSSTYQQPDSSYGVFPGYIYPPPPVPYVGSHSYWPDNGYWDPRLTNRPSAISYERLQGQVPDSLTEDHEEYEEVDRWVDETQLYFPDQSVKFQSRDPREKGSVQAHEISSNSAKDFPTARERKEQGTKTMERNDMKERGPLKKRITDLGSDSESDGGSQERKKLKTESEPLSILPQGSSVDRPLCFMEDFRDPQRWKEYAKEGKMPCYFDLIEENVYLTERKKNKSHRDIKRMLCECPTVSKEELAQGEAACGEDCLNRLLMIECSSRCPNGEHCSNRRFQRKQHADVEVILTEKKGWGLRAAKDLPPNTFVLEYCGEVLDHKEFKTRVKEYARSKNIHYYFMALKNDEIIDATQKGNCSRFMNHSCEPNCETQKWTVNGQLRVGFFTTKLVTSGSELTFDYQFQRYGKEAQKCFCGSTNCRGYLGGENRVSIRAAGGKMKKERSRKKDSVDGELEALLENGEGLSDKNQVLSLSRLMVRIETPEQKLTCLKLIQNPTSDEGSSGEQSKAVDLNSKMKDLSAHDAGEKMDTIEGGGGGGLACSTIPAMLKNKKRLRKENKRTSGMKTTAAIQQEGLTHKVAPHTEMSLKPEDPTSNESSSKEFRMDLSQTVTTVNNAQDAEKKVDPIAAEEDLACSTISANLKNKERVREAMSGSPRTGEQKALPQTSRRLTKRKTLISTEGGSKKKRSISLDLKMKIIKAYRARKKMKIVAKEEGLSYSTIFTILKDKKRIREALKVFPGTRKIITKARKCLLRPLIPHTKIPAKPKTPSSTEGCSKKSRKSISLDLKMKIIKAYEAGTKAQVIAQEEGLARTTILTILKNQKRIKEAMKELTGTKTVITEPQMSHIQPPTAHTSVSADPNPAPSPPKPRWPQTQISTNVSTKPTTPNSTAGRGKKRRTPINLNRKMKIIEAYEGGKKVSAIAREEGLGHTTIFTILKHSKRIKEALKELPGTRKMITRRQKAIVHPETSHTKVSANPETPTSAKVSTDSETPTSAKMSTDSETTTSAKMSTDPETPTSAKVSTDPETPTSAKMSTDSETPTSAKMSTDPETPTSAKERIKKQRKSIDLNFKMKIIKANEAGKKTNVIAREEGLSRTTVWTILRDRKKIRELYKGSTGTDSSITRNRIALIHQTEQLLVLWIEDQIRKGDLVSFHCIQEKTRSIFALLKERAGEAFAKTFDASRGWFLRFQRRFNYRNIPTKGKTTGLDEEVARRFRDELDSVLVEGEYLPEQIFSVNSTRLSWKKLPEGTYLHQETQAVPGYKTFHDRVTLLLGGNVAGFKLKPFVIHKSEDPYVFQKDTIPVHYQSDRKIWMTHILFESWLMTYFVPQVKDYCSQMRIPFKILLIFGSAPGRPSNLDNLQADVKVVYLPKNTSPLLHPMDQGAIAAFKAYYLREVLTEAVTAMEKSRVSLNEFWSRYDILRCMEKIVVAWQAVGATCMQGIWEKCLKRFADLVKNFEGFDPDEDLDKTNQNILALSQSLGLQVDAEAVKKWLASMEGDLSNEDLIELREELSSQEVVEEKEAEKKQKTQDDIKAKKFTKSRLASVFREVDTILSELKSMDPNPERYERVHGRIHEIMQHYREIYENKRQNRMPTKN